MMLSARARAGRSGGVHRVLRRGFAAKPTVKPANPEFSSGPCTKRPGWSLAALVRPPRRWQLAAWPPPRR